jgi:hypothetical protein
MECSEFIARIEEQYPRVCWANVQLKINAVLRAVLEAVSK